MNETISRILLQNIELHVNSWLEFKVKDSPISTHYKNNCQNKFLLANF